MAHDTHTTNPALSIILGVGAGVVTFMSEHPLIASSAIELLKVVTFGIIGGFMGFFGKIVAERMFNKYGKKNGIE